MTKRLKLALNRLQKAINFQSTQSVSTSFLLVLDDIQTLINHIKKGKNK